MSRRSTSSSVVRAMPQSAAWARVAFEVGTPITFIPARTFSPKRSTKCLAVEPVPSPSFMPSRTCSSARAAACRFSASISTCRPMPPVCAGFLASFRGQEQRPEGYFGEPMELPGFSRPHLHDGAPGDSQSAMTSPRIVVFDLDGTLVEPRPT